MRCVSFSLLLMTRSLRCLLLIKCSHMVYSQLQLSAVRHRKSNRWRQYRWHLFPRLFPLFCGALHESNPFYNDPFTGTRDTRANEHFKRQTFCHLQEHFVWQVRVIAFRHFKSHFHSKTPSLQGLTHICARQILWVLQDDQNGCHQPF